LILRRELLAGLDFERCVGGKHTVGVHVLVREELGIVGDDVAGELQRRGIQREALDDVQLAAVREVACQGTRQQADRADDERIAIPPPE
jgi:hypothetical protein